MLSLLTWRLLLIVIGWSLSSYAISNCHDREISDDQNESDSLSLQDQVLVASIQIQGNKITREKIILREMMVRQGERIEKSKLQELLARSRENLLNTALFNFVEITFDERVSGEAGILVEVVERWYVWPVPILKISDRNFNVWWETKDFSRLSYGFYIDWRNFRGRREKLVTRFQFGYDQLFDFHYSIPYLNRKQTIGLGFGAGYHQNHEASYITRYNKQVFYNDENEPVRKDIFAFVQLQVRRNIYNTHLLEIRYDHHDFADSLIILNPSFSVNGQTRLSYLTLHYKYKSDHRDFAHIP